MSKIPGSPPEPTWILALPVPAAPSTSPVTVRGPSISPAPSRTSPVTVPSPESKSPVVSAAVSTTKFPPAGMLTSPKVVLPVSTSVTSNAPVSSGPSVSNNAPSPSEISAFAVIVASVSLISTLPVISPAIFRSMSLVTTTLSA